MEYNHAHSLGLQPGSIRRKNYIIIRVYIRTYVLLFSKTLSAMMKSLNLRVLRNRHHKHILITTLLVTLNCGQQHNWQLFITIYLFTYY